MSCADCRYSADDCSECKAPPVTASERIRLATVNDPGESAAVEFDRPTDRTSIRLAELERKVAALVAFIGAMPDGPKL